MNGTDTVLSELAIKPNELIEVHAAKVELTRPEDSGSSTPAPAQNAWKTDTDISGRGQIKERVLQAWQPSPDDEGFSIEDDLSTATKTGTTTKKWDQFAANEKLFGVKSQWDEDMYTHKLDTTRPDFARRQAEAERLAREIEQSSSTNAHVLEERGVVDDSGLTEEDKYSGVQRNPNAWVPPARRPIVNLPTPRVSSVDPAIISSQLAKPGSSGHRSMVSEINVQRPTSGENNKSNDAAPTSVSKTANAIETDIMARFKQFATNERDRLSVKKAATFKKEKDGRLQDLLAFSKDFKLSTPVPEDLIPILAKDKAKQEAIVQKAASGSSSSPSTAKPESPATKPVDSKSDTLRSRLDKAHQAPVPQATPTPLTREQSTELKKLKPSAAEFKPFNPAATSFTPSFAQKQPQSSSPALSTASSQPRQSQFSVEASAFFARPPKLVSERPSILEQFDPFKTYAAKNPTSVLDIETPLKVDPAWPSTQNSPSITDPPQDSRRIPLAEEQFSNQQQYISGPSPQMGFTGSPQQSHSFQQQPNYYSNKNQQFIPAPPGQFSPYQTAHSFVPPQYMYPGVQGYNPRMMQPHIMQVPYPPQQFNNYNPACMPTHSSRPI